MTVQDALAKRAIDTENRRAPDLRRAAEMLTAALPIDRTVKITPDAIDAALAGDRALLTTLFAQEVEPDPIKLAAVAEADAEDDGTRLLTADVRGELGLI